MESIEIPTFGQIQYLIQKYLIQIDFCLRECVIVILTHISHLVRDQEIVLVAYYYIFFYIFMSFYMFIFYIFIYFLKNKQIAKFIELQVHDLAC